MRTHDDTQVAGIEPVINLQPIPGEYTGHDGRNKQQRLYRNNDVEERVFEIVFGRKPAACLVGCFEGQRCEQNIGKRE